MKINKANISYSFWYSCLRTSKGHRNGLHLFVRPCICPPVTFFVIVTPLKSLVGFNSKFARLLGVTRTWSYRLRPILQKNVVGVMKYFFYDRGSHLATWSNLVLQNICIFCLMFVWKNRDTLPSGTQTGLAVHCRPLGESPFVINHFYYTLSLDIFSKFTLKAIFSTLI